MFKSLHKENGKKVKISIVHHKRYTILKFKSMFSCLLEKSYNYYPLKTFRKNFATDMSSMGMTIQEVQALLDHKDPATTLRYYANVKAEKLKEKIDKLQLLSADKSADKN